MDESKLKPDGNPMSKMPGGAGVGTPFAGESSGGGETIVPPDSRLSNGPVAEPIDPGATIVDSGPAQFDPDATVINARLPVDPNATLYDAGATIAPRSSSRRTPAPNSGGEMYSGAAVLQIGDVLGGRYEILQLLGQGGMGAVYKASDRELDRFVALKVIRPELASNPSILARFKQELLLSHQVTHRNVIRIYDLGEAEGLRFITMEFVEGKDLRSLMLQKTKFSCRGSRGHFAGLPGFGGGTRRGRDSPGPETAKHYAGHCGPNLTDGFRIGPHRGRRRNDPDRPVGWHHGLHVA